MNKVLLRFFFVFAGICSIQISIAAELDLALPNSNFNYTWDATAETSNLTSFLSNSQSNFSVLINPNIKGNRLYQNENGEIYLKPKVPGEELGELVLKPIIDMVYYSAMSCYNILSYPCSNAWQNLKNFSINLDNALSFPGAEAKTNTNDIGNHMQMLAGVFASVFSVSSPQVDRDACVYLPPTVETTDNFFHEIVIQSNNPETNFNDLLAEVARRQESLHRFQFRYQLENENHAKEFFQALEIKAQSAHLFVPVFADCQFLQPKHSGFLREAHIKNGPTIFEHVLIDQALKSILFVEETVRLPDGKVVEGSFASVNSVVEIEGKWYFAGVYLYNRPFSMHDVESTRTMFKETYVNLARFIEEGRLSAEYRALHPY